MAIRPYDDQGDGLHAQPFEGLVLRAGVDARNTGMHREGHHRFDDVAVGKGPQLAQQPDRFVPGRCCADKEKGGVAPGD